MIVIISIIRIAYWLIYNEIFDGAGIILSSFIMLVIGFFVISTVWTTLMGNLEKSQKNEIEDVYIVTMYSDDGRAVKQWTSEEDVTDNGNYIWFTDKYGDEVSIKDAKNVVVTKQKNIKPDVESN